MFYLQPRLWRWTQPARIRPRHGAAVLLSGDGTGDPKFRGFRVLRVLRAFRVFRFFAGAVRTCGHERNS
jgi:hypothetical protein